jgi:CheY-like chemotaxis protein
LQPETSASLNIVDYELVTDEQHGSSVMLALQVNSEAEGMADEDLRRERLDSFLQGIQVEKTPAVDEVNPELLQLKLSGDLARHLTMIFGREKISYEIKYRGQQVYELHFKIRYIQLSLFAILLAVYIIHQIYRAGDVDQRSRALLQIGRVYFKHGADADKQLKQEVIAELTGRFENETVNAFITMLHSSKRTIGNIMRKILLVDDVNYLTEIYGDALASRGFSVHTAADGQEALQLLRRNQYDLLVTDLQMPTMDGVELFYSVKQSRAKLPVMLITGWHHKEDVERLLRDGAITCLMKPFSLPELVQEVEGYFVSREMMNC